MLVFQPYLGTKGRHFETFPIYLGEVNCLDGDK